MQTICRILHLIILFILIFYSTLYSQSHKLFINEFMTSNDTTITDNFGEYEDSIEIYNAENLDVSLRGYYLTDDFDNPIELRKFDYREYPIFGFLFTESSADNQAELENILTSDLTQYIEGA